MNYKRKDRVPAVRKTQQFVSPDLQRVGHNPEVYMRGIQLRPYSACPPKRRYKISQIFIYLLFMFFTTQPYTLYKLAPHITVNHLRCQLTDCRAKTKNRDSPIIPIGQVSICCTVTELFRRKFSCVDAYLVAYRRSYGCYGWKFIGSYNRHLYGLP